jgi:general stress protein 26
MTEKPGLEDALGCSGSRSIVSLATCDGDRPAVRPMTLLRIDGGFCSLTFCDSHKVAQTRSDPRCQLILDLADGDESGFVSADCNAIEVRDGLARERLFSLADYARQFWSGPDDPNCCLLLSDIEGVELMRPGEMYLATIEMNR